MLVSGEAEPLICSHVITQVARNSSLPVWEKLSELNNKTERMINVTDFFN